MGLLKKIWQKIRGEKTIPAIDEIEGIRNPITFNQAFFLYNLYQWLQEKQEETVIKNCLNKVIAINYSILKKQFNLPGKSFDDFTNRADVVYSQYLNTMYKIKEEEGLISESNLEYSLTEKGKRVVQIIKMRKLYNCKSFDNSLKNSFSERIVKSIDKSIVRMKGFSDNSLKLTAITCLKR